MAAACRERIVAAVAAALASIADPAGVTVERARRVPLTDADLPRLVVFQGRDEPHEPGDCFTGERGLTLAVLVEGFAAGATEAEAKANLAALRAAMTHALLADVTLGGLARDLRAAPEPPPARLDLDCAAPTQRFACGFEVDYATLETDPFVFA